MRLSTIKLAGFKSFVDPTTLHFPTNMTGVVGPNGCGKSNVIDAVRWVMGESAAGRLRGDALADVIFSGSSGRKPVGQASVELLFDNSDGAISGEYADYAELSVRRVGSRDGQSQYFLNGSRCRRRDITDLFLGTGLGPRSYSIIEQGVISDIVESHPEQLRQHLEEAAGITRYKERRKETESRIRQTRENIDRIKDIAEEVDKQLEHLSRQARAAERWKSLKAEHNLRGAELHALSYRSVAAELATHSDTLRETMLDIEKHLAEQRAVEARLEQARSNRQQAHDELEQIQAESYKVGADIARVEQQARHSRELKQRLQQARQEVEQAQSELSRQLATDTAQADTLGLEVTGGEPRLQALAGSQQVAATALHEAEAHLTAWQTRWDRHAGETSAAAQAAEVERTRIDYLDRQSMELGKRRLLLDEEHQSIDVAALDDVGKRLDVDHENQATQLEALTKLLEQRKTDHQAVLDDERAVQSDLNELRQKLHTGRGRLASLEALQHAALGHDRAELNEWLQQAGLDPSRRLGSELDVDHGWETAVETVLHGLLEGVLVDQSPDWAAQIGAAGDVDLAMVDSVTGQDGASGTLAEHARGPNAALQLLGQVACAESLDEAARLAAALTPGRSVICRDGEWFGSGFVRVLRAPDRQGGVLAREREIQQLAEEVQTLERRVAEVSDRLETLRTAKFEAERNREDAQRDSYQAHRRLSELAGELQGHRGKLETSRARVAKVAAELTELSPRMADIEHQTRAARTQLESGVARMGELEQQRQALQDERRLLLEQREEARLNAREADAQFHQLALALESKRAALTSLQQGQSRTQTQLDQLHERGTELDQQLAAGTDPEADLERERHTYLDQRLLVDRRLVDARKSVEQHDGAIRNHEQDRQQRDQTVAALREGRAEKRLAEQALRLQGEQLARGIKEAGLDTDSLLAELPADADPEQWTPRLQALEQKIQRLEPVNLAAIQEHDEHAQRKQYLDAQMADLNSALETLESAIKKIDRETRARFKETFDKVNAGLQQLFPRLFGGGHAYLEMTGDDLLSTGVAIMARPPGKRISNISLMSGGEKALCAVALVMAIFQLNPAPFCILDEVDAPLDEANVGRFSSMVLEMSEQVQFIFVTHNKATMEAAHQLCGVTMREPGVSRLVQVDLAEAAKLAGVA